MRRAASPPGSEAASLRTWRSASQIASPTHKFWQGDQHLLNYTQKLPKTLVKTLSDVLFSSYLRTFLWLTYKFILKFLGDMKEPLHHMPTTHDKGLSYLLHHVLNEICRLCQTRQRHPRQAVKWHFQRNGSNGLCADSTARREYSFNSKSSCSVNLSSYYEDLSNPVNIRSLNQRQVIQLWV